MLTTPSLTILYHSIYSCIHQSLYACVIYTGKGHQTGCGLHGRSHVYFLICQSNILFLFNYIHSKEKEWGKKPCMKGSLMTSSEDEARQHHRGESNLLCNVLNNRSV